jgi:hypothetical protein
MDPDSYYFIEDSEKIYETVDTVLKRKINRLFTTLQFLFVKMFFSMATKCSCKIWIKPDPDADQARSVIN